MYLFLAAAFFLPSSRASSSRTQGYLPISVSDEATAVRQYTQTAADAARLAGLNPTLLDPMAEAGFTGMDYSSGVSCVNSHGAAKNPDDERNSRLSTLVADALREQRGQLPEGMVAGAYMLITWLSFFV